MCVTDSSVTERELATPSGSNSSCRHTVLASSSSQCLSAQTVPHRPSRHTSTRPSYSLLPSTSRMSPLAHRDPTSTEGTGTSAHGTSHMEGTYKGRGHQHPRHGSSCGHPARGPDTPADCPLTRRTQPHPSRSAPPLVHKSHWSLHAGSLGANTPCQRQDWRWNGLS